jgi:hypothetical protein
MRKALSFRLFALALAFAILMRTSSSLLRTGTTQWQGRLADGGNSGSAAIGADIAPVTAKGYNAKDGMPVKVNRVVLQVATAAVAKDTLLLTASSVCADIASSVFCRLVRQVMT